MGTRHVRVPEADWKGILEEAVDRLRDILRMDTTNPPGNEAVVIDYLGAVLHKEKIPFKTFEPAPGRANMVARLKGNGAKQPLLLNAHVDVVGVEKEQWSHDPFGAEVAQGCIWGRGALDMKHMVVMALMCLVLAKRYKLPMKRDLIFAAVADEETGGLYGSQWLVDNHPESIRSEYAFGEIGGFSKTVGGKRFYPVQIAEKGACWLKITARGEPGHGSLPNWQGAVAKIGRAAALLGSSRLPFHRTPEAEAFVKTLATYQPLPKKRILLQVLNPRLSNFVLDYILPDKAMARSLYAILHNTANPTVIRGGEKINVLPSQATLEVDGRTLPGQTPEQFVKEVRAVIGDDYEIEVTKRMPPVSTSPQDPILGYIQDALRRHDPGAIVVPFMVPGLTDAKHYSRLGIRCFGFSPVRLPEDFNFIELMHGHDERIPIEGFHFGLKVLFDLVGDLCT